MGQSVSLPTSSSTTCPQCRLALPQRSKHCPSCGYANPIFLEAFRYGVPSTQRAAEDRALAAQEVGQDGVGCVYCGWPMRRGQMYCTECGQPQPLLDPASDPRLTPRTRSLMLRRTSDTRQARSSGQLTPTAAAAAAAGVEDPRRPSEVPHPMGVEALVTPTGKPTLKLQALSNAIFTLLTSPSSNALTGSHSKRGVIDIPRLQYLEEKLGRRPEYMLSSLHPGAVLAVYRTMGLEHALVPFPPPAQHLEAPCLTNKGLMQYLQHGILYDPHEAVRELQSLLASTPELPGPPSWLAQTQANNGIVPPGSKGIWWVEENMALSHPHPRAEQKQEQVLQELEKMGFAPPGTSNSGSSSARRRSRRASAPGTPDMNANNGWPSPYLSPGANPYLSWPWAGYFTPSPSYPYTALPSPGLGAGAGAGAGWAAYPPHPYSPPVNGARRSPYGLGGGSGGGMQLPGSPRRQVHSDEDWDYRGYEDIR